MEAETTDRVKEEEIDALLSDLINEIDYDAWKEYFLYDESELELNNLRLIVLNWLDR